MADMAEQIGFIGLGIMGRPMAHNLLTAGYALVVHNRSRGPVDELVAAGASAAATPREVAQQCDLVITMLPDGPDVRAVATGESGLLAGARPGMLWIDMSTIAPGVAQELARLAGERGVALLDAPVSGGDAGARAGTLSIMVGGSAADVARAEPILRALGTTIVHVGPSGVGQVVKACNQIVVALTIEAVSEALVLGAQAGVDPAVILRVLSGGLAANRVIELRGRNFLEHDFTPGFKVRLHEKDLAIALAAGREYGAALPATALVEQMLLALKQLGRGELDHSALLTLLEDWAGRGMETA
jgi:2-hydroxy-3-oxopropionate reductase